MSKSEYTINKVSRPGGQWQVLKWDWDLGEEYKEWTQVGPYWDTEAEAENAIAALEAEET